jgi:hypothetical protein
MGLLAVKASFLYSESERYALRLREPSYYLASLLGPCRGLRRACRDRLVCASSLPFVSRSSGKLWLRESRGERRRGEVTRSLFFRALQSCVERRCLKH